MAIPMWMDVLLDPVWVIVYKPLLLLPAVFAIYGSVFIPQLEVRPTAKVIFI